MDKGEIIMDDKRTDELILGLPRKDKIKIIKKWQSYMEELSKEGKKIMKRRISWLRKSLKKKEK